MSKEVIVKLKILLAIGVVLIFAGGIGCQPEVSPDLPRYTEAQVTTIASNYVKTGDARNYIASVSYEGNGIWEVTCKWAKGGKWEWVHPTPPFIPYQKYVVVYETGVLIFDETTGAIH